MADAEVKLKFAGSSADAERAIATLERKIQNLENGVKQLTKRNRDAVAGWNELKESAGDFISSLTGIRSPMDVAIKMTGILRDEWQDLIDRQEKALGSNRSYASSLETLAFNTAGDAKYDTLEKVEALVRSISQETGVGIKEVAAALSNAASAKGMLPLEDAAAAVRTVLTFAPNTPALQDVMSGAALDVRKMYPNATPEDAVGFAAMLGQQARITDPAKVAENALPGAILMSKVDKGSLRDNAAIYAAITQSTGDVQGRTSRTGGIALAIQLEKALPELNGTLERVKFLQENPELGKQFLEGGGKFKGKGLSFDVKGPDGEDISFGTDRASFEKKVLPAIRELLTKGSATDVNLQSALAAIPEIDKGRDVYQKQLEGLQRSKTLSIAGKERRFQSSAEIARIDDSEGANAAAVRKGFEENLSARGVGNFYRLDAAFSKFFREVLLRQSPDEAAANTAEAYAKEMTDRARATNIPGLKERYTRGAAAFSDVARIHRDYLPEPEENPGEKVLDVGRSVEAPQLPASPTKDSRTVEQLEAEQKARFREYQAASAEGDEKSVKELKEVVRQLGELIAQAKKEKRLPVDRNGQVGG